MEVVYRLSKVTVDLTHRMKHQMMEMASMYKNVHLMEVVYKMSKVDMNVAMSYRMQHQVMGPL